MSLDVYLERVQKTVVFQSGITHNLNRMAVEAELYYPLWRPDQVNAKTAADLKPLLEAGLLKLKANPGYFLKYNPPNGWGNYDALVKFVEEYLNACILYPDATIDVSR
jgi:hypothetical protein